MTTALGYIYNIYTAFLNLVFNVFAISSGVTIGWIVITIIVFGLMINNILNLPKSAPSIRRSKNG